MRFVFFLSVSNIDVGLGHLDWSRNVCCLGEFLKEQINIVQTKGTLVTIPGVSLSSYPLLTC